MLTPFPIPEATYMSLEDISATATYMDPNSFEHYGVDLDMFNVL